MGHPLGRKKLATLSPLFSSACVATMGGSEFGGSNFVMVDRGNDKSVSFDDAMALLGEIERLRSELARSEARQAELEMLAHRDPLVDLPNRRSFLSSLENVIAQSRTLWRPGRLVVRRRGWIEGDQ